MYFVSIYGRFSSHKRYLHKDGTGWNFNYRPNTRVAVKTVLGFIDEAIKKWRLILMIAKSRMLN